MLTKSAVKNICGCKLLVFVKPPSLRRISSDASGSWDIIPRKEVKRFIVQCMSSVKTRLDHAELLADNLCTADYRGHYSHGLNRLGNY